MSERSPFWVPVLAALAVLLTATVLRWPRVGSEWPDLGLTVALLAALSCGAEAGLVGGLTVGLLSGWLAGAALPAFVLSRLVPPVIVGRLRDLLHRDNMLAQMLVVAAGTALSELLFVVGWPAVLEQPGWAGRVLVRTALCAAVTPLIAWPLSHLPEPEETYNP